MHTQSGVTAGHPRQNRVPRALGGQRCGIHGTGSGAVVLSGSRMRAANPGS